MINNTGKNLDKSTIHKDNKYNPLIFLNLHMGSINMLLMTK